MLGLVCLTAPLCDALDEHFGAAASYTKPVGGIYLWVTLPKHVDTEKLLAASLAEGVEINPGPHWAVDKTANKNKMRICFGHPTQESIKQGIKNATKNLAFPSLVEIR